MTLSEIKAAVERGDTVHWANEGYVVVKDSIGQWLIIWKRGELGEHCIGLTWRDGVTMNGNEDQFFVAPKKPFKDKIIIYKSINLT